jgi:hypothetical protein
MAKIRVKLQVTKKQFKYYTFGGWSDVASQWAYYEPGEIFLTRIISYMGDNFAIHDPMNYPSKHKKHIEDMVRNKMDFIQLTKNEVSDYQAFMKLAGPYWMSCTHATAKSDLILDPDEYTFYH